ncbi:unnamed protein product, partial [Coccothraustes coccothraustes]
MPAQITALGCHKATKDPGEEDAGTSCSFAEGNLGSAQPVQPESKEPGMVHSAWHTPIHF